MDGGLVLSVDEVRVIDDAALEELPDHFLKVGLASESRPLCRICFDDVQGGLTLVVSRQAQAVFDNGVLYEIIL